MLIPILPPECPSEASAYVETMNYDNVAEPSLES